MKYTIEESGAFVHTFEIVPTGSGVLDGLSFASKDLIDLAGQKTGCGNPRWQETHPPAVAHAICVEQLLAAGARCIGKTVTDELAYSLIGENHFYGTPLNPAAPDRVPGGSSCGSASAVACGLADFALGTDTGGSVRVPASNCRIWGIRPTHGVVSVAGVNPLSPGFDTVGVLASTGSVLAKVGSVLLSASIPEDPKPSTIHLIKEAFEVADPKIAAAVLDCVETMSEFNDLFRETSIREIDAENSVQDLSNWYEIYRVLQRAEAWNCLGAWIESAKPEMGSMIRESIELARNLDRQLVPPMLKRREHYFLKMKSFLGVNDLLCIPTAASVAPPKGTIERRDQAANGYYFRTLSLTSIAGVARSPQISMPLVDLDGIPVGVSIIGRHHEDAFLLGVAKRLGAR
ncbi:amidase [bacterium]|nr:amidase [bacterium]